MNMLLGTAGRLGALLALGTILMLTGPGAAMAQTPNKPKAVEKSAPKQPAEAKKEEAENNQEQEAEQKSPEDAKKAAENKQAAAVAARKAKAVQQLEIGSKALSAGKNEDAAKALTQALDTGALTQSDVTRAIYRRALAYRKLGRTSDAIAGLNQALLLTGLSEQEKLDARYQRGLAYQALGDNRAAEDLKAGKPLDPTLVATAPADLKVPKPTKAEPPREQKQALAPETKRVAPEPATKAAPTKTASTTAPTSPAPANSNSVSAFFSNLFSSQPKEPQKVPAPRTSTWQQATEVKLTATNPSSKPTEPAVKPVIVPSATREITTASIEGKSRVTLQIASLRTEAQATALVRQVKSSHRDLLSGRDIRVEKAVIGTMGTFYQVRIAHFASENEVQTHCGRLRQAGLDCMIVK
ncbi:MAG: hypothetical protein F9K44_03820 [Hyphomicrobiaceae bacterium]|nr:MAG: hypothetical protein F9K44_03820 [Hyphomicrobiaceae bacterium]